MTPQARKRTSAVAGVLILVALVVIVAGLVVVQYAHYQPESAEAQEHPEVGSQPCTSCKVPLHDYAHEAP
ncbi:MAG TPA: hypothetical protein ENN10_04455, partial [Actinobacteria bacterium]|nr:hypothetical protein [Actinomycetota bacterium]